ncbi:MAG: arginine--tRNA ligase [Candidatus Aenigmarchaeota archaeon]|nr:arginine--tRNA ligase [Candidatus Aenigmarchaeota archaeon]
MKEIVLKVLKEAGIKATENELEIPPSDELGDFAFPCFKLAKKEERNSQEIAKEIEGKIKLPPIISQVEAKAGYVNFFFNYERLTQQVLERILKEKERYGRSNIGKRKFAVIDYSSPNPAHPIHVGSARTTFIGESLARILTHSGYKVKRICYINDLGKQVAILLWGYLKFARGKKPSKKPDYWLLDIYVKASQAIRENPSLEREIEELLRRCEYGDRKILKILKKIVNWCIRGFKKTYKTLGIKFDEYPFESSFNEISKKYVDELLKCGHAFRTSDNAIVADLKKFNLPSTILLRYDGTSLYLTRDIAASIYKFKKYRPRLNIYVVGEEQKLHFQQQFKILELLGFEDFVKNSFHVSYGLVTLPTGKISSRLGRVILIDDVFGEAILRVKEKYTKYEKIARAVGIGAVIYAILKIDPNKKVSFSWDEILALEGDTGPYLQYAYTRCASILRKAEKRAIKFKVEKLLKEEKKLVKALAMFPEIVKRATEDLKPNYVCNYAYDLATTFATFYQFCPVLKAETNELKNFRLALVKATRITLGNCLWLMNIKSLERM